MMNTRALPLSRGLLLLAAVGLTACGPKYQETDFTIRSTAPVPIVATPDLIELPAGIAVDVSVEPLSTNSYEYDDYYTVRLKSRDRGVFDVADGPTEREFVFLGIHAGTTCVEIIIEGELQECIDVTVTNPES